MAVRLVHSAQQIDPRDLLRSAAEGYALALVDLYRAQRSLAAAYLAGDDTARRRAGRVLHAQTAVADRAHDAVEHAAEVVARST